MNGWVKKFTDGNTEVGSDYDVKNKKASWSRGRLSHITSVELHHNDSLIIIEGTGEFWQSDDLEARMMVNHSYNLVTRRIQKRIETTDNWLLIDSIGRYRHYRFLSHIIGVTGGYRRRLDGLSGKWFTVEMDVAASTITFDFKEGRI